MKKLIAVSLIAAASLGLAACEQKPADNLTVSNEEVVANDELGADVNATSDNSVAVNETGASLNETGNVTH